MRAPGATEAAARPAIRTVDSCIYRLMAGCVAVYCEPVCCAATGRRLSSVNTHLVRTGAVLPLFSAARGDTVAARWNVSGPGPTFIRPLRSSRRTPI